MSTSTRAQSPSQRSGECDPAHYHGLYLRVDRSKSVRRQKSDSHRQCLSNSAHDRLCRAGCSTAGQAIRVPGFISNHRLYGRRGVAYAH